MLRQSVSKIISVSLNGARTSVNRPFTSKTPDTLDWIYGGEKTKKSICEEMKEQDQKFNDGMKKKSPCDEKADAGKISPCGEAKKKPCPEPMKKKPCPEPVKKPCPETVKKPCPEPVKPCPEIVKKPVPDSKKTDALCSHHKSLVPPGSVLSQLKMFELRSNCTTFHMKTTGFDE